MKSAQSILVLCLMLCMTATPALANDAPKDTQEELRENIVNMIRSNRPDVSGIPAAERVATIEFVVTSGNKLVILDVIAANSTIDNYLHSQLNYKKLKVKGVKYLTPYRLDITFRSAS